MSYPYLTDLANAVLDSHWNLPIPTFGLLVVAAIFIAASAARKAVEHQESIGRLPLATHAVVWDLALVSAVAGLVGARVFHIADYPGQFLQDPASMIFTRSGFSIYGGLCFGIATGIWYLRRRAIPVVPMLDAVAPALMLGYGVGRLGCQLAGDGDWGIPANLALKPAWLPDWLWAQTYDGNILGVTLPAPGVYPTPLYEFAAAICLFGVLCALRSRRHLPGYSFSLYLLLAGFERLLIEKIRVNVRHDVLGDYLTQAEVVSLAVIVAGLAGLMATVQIRPYWKILLTLGVLSALSACTPF